jgi:hypothetical protein
LQLLEEMNMGALRADVGNGMLLQNCDFFFFPGLFHYLYSRCLNYQIFDAFCTSLVVPEVNLKAMTLDG